MFRKSIAQKLFDRKDAQILIVNEPPLYREKIGALEENSAIIHELVGPVDFIQFFITTQEELEAQLTLLKSALKADGALWVTFPRKRSREMSDGIAAYAEGVGLRRVAITSVDAQWHAMRLEIVPSSFILEM